MAIALTLITLAFGPVVGRNPHSLHDRDHGPSLGTDGSNPALSSGESANFQFLARCDCDGETRFIALAYGKFESSSLHRGVRKLQSLSVMTKAAISSHRATKARRAHLSEA